MSNLVIGIDVLSHPRSIRLRAWLGSQWPQEGKGTSSVDFEFDIIVRQLFPPVNHSVPSQRLQKLEVQKLRSETSRPETCLRGLYVERTDRMRLWNAALA